MAATTVISDVDHRSGPPYAAIGSFSGSNIDVKSSLERLIQTIGTLPNTDAATRAELARPTAELSARLQQLPPAQVAEHGAVATLTGELIEKAAARPRNPALPKAGARRGARSRRAPFGTGRVCCITVLGRPSRSSGWSGLTPSASSIAYPSPSAMSPRR